jgi:hypothetical protein
MRSGGRITLRNLLSPLAKIGLARLRDDPEKRARATIEDQIRKPKAPWQLQRVARTLGERGAARPMNGAVAEGRPPGSRTNPKGSSGPRRSTPPAQGRKDLQPVRRARVSEQPFEFWDLPPEAAVRERPPASISSETRSTFEKVVRVGGPPDPSASGEDLFATIGLDFGTSAAKVIVRFPYEAGTPAIAIPAPAHCRSMDHSYLWQTVLWIDQSGEFKPWPERDAHLLYALKQGLMGEHLGDNLVSNLAGGQRVSRVDAAAAFLAFVIRYTRGWLLQNRPQLFRLRQPVWFVNVGLPAANFDDDALVSTYRRVAAAAFLLANFGGPLTAKATQLFLADEHVLAAAGSAADAEELGIAVIPETAAEAAGFAKSTDSAPGLYLMVDVGTMTLDVCAFRLQQRGPAQDRYALLNAQVRPLGVEAYYWFLGMGKTKVGFGAQCDRCLREVIWGLKKDRRDPYADCFRPGHDLPVFLVGGGAQNDLHRRRIEALHAWLREHARNDGIRLLDLPIPRNVDLPVHVADFARLAVAWGLSYLPNEIGDILPPSTIDDVPPAKAIDLTDRFVSKDLV